MLLEIGNRDHMTTEGTWRRARAATIFLEKLRDRELENLLDILREADRMSMMTSMSPPTTGMVNRAVAAPNLYACLHFSSIAYIIFCDRSHRINNDLMI
jgi:hypothetical protein